MKLSEPIRSLACVFALLFLPTAFSMQAMPVKGKITLDGKLDEADWQRASVAGDFIENMPNEKTPARFKTEVRVLFDDQALYFGVRAWDSDPSLIVAPFVRRDKVFANQDNFIIWIDPTGARKFAQFFRVNPRGVLADGVWNEDALEEDFSPDYDFQAVPILLPDGWSAEFRIPWASLRLPHPAPEKLTFIAFRNMPRETRIRMSNVSLGRDPSCFLCVAEELTGLADLPRASSLTVTPYVAVNSSETKRGSEKQSEIKVSGGADVKWRPSSAWVIDATFRPDFSQLELDTPQLKGNTRFALSVQEKRPFFLEGSDLYATPLNTIYTRSITDPLWGARTTYRSERADATVLTVADRGGGYVILPGTYSSNFRDQGASQATLARLRMPFTGTAGTGSAGLLLADRNYDDGSRNQVVSFDGVYKPGDEMRFRAQALASQTSDVLAGGRSNGQAMVADGFYDNGKEHVYVRLGAISPKFRADNSIIAQNGYRAVDIESWQCRKLEGFFNQVCPGVNAKEQRAWDNTPLNRFVTPVLGLNGNRNSYWSFQPRWLNYTRTRDGGAWHHIPTFYARAEGNPSTRFPYAFFETEFGRGVDVATDTKARLMFNGVTLNWRAHERIEFEGTISDYRLNDLANARWRLHETTAQLVGVGYLTAQDTVRLIAQRSLSKRNPEMYTFAVTQRAHTQAVSLVYSHKRGLGRELNVGVTHGNARASLQPNRTTTELFAKLSWAVNL